ncbi:MAG: ABC transporter substrate-binding protein [Betaproteobacteria bacterium]
MKLRSSLAVVLALLAVISPAGARTLVVNANTADPAPRAAWEATVARFQREYPDIQVQFNIYDSESYKKSIRNWLTGAPPDVVYWFAGYRMRQFVTPGLLEDISDLYTPDLKASIHRSALDLVSVGEKQYGVPYTYYQVGLYFRRDLLAAAGVAEPPGDWRSLVSACDKLKAKGIEPFAVGTRDLWPAAGWFDYLDLRLNGLAFHMDLMRGAIAYTDTRVRDIFERWRELLEKNCFSRNHASSSWQESQALLYSGKAAMMLIGNFIVANFPADVRDRMDFVAFPSIRRDFGRFEDAPVNTIHIPAGARNKEDARRFLAFVMRADVQEAINKATLQIPVNLRAAVADDRFIVRGRDLLARADGLAQYFDRDTSEDLANIAMKGFQEFMLYPERLEATLVTIERARARIYGALPVPAAAK